MIWGKKGEKKKKKRHNDHHLEKKKERGGRKRGKLNLPLPVRKKENSSCKGHPERGCHHR